MPLSAYRGATGEVDAARRKCGGLVQWIGAKGTQP
jgi:hypothetical protein